MTLKNSQKFMQQHSEVKIRLLRLYLERYLNILNQSQHVADIHVFDLFCGQGFYENGSKGSPLVILETIKNIHFANVAKQHPVGKFNCYFNDIDSVKIDTLRKTVKDRNLHYPEIGEIYFTKRDYRSLLPHLKEKLSTFKNEKAFVFLDPYGYKYIRIRDIHELMSFGKAEVLLFLPTQFMFRFHSKGTPESMIEFISELMPEKEWPKSTTGIEFIEKLTEAFRGSFEGRTFVDSFIISRELNQFFCLFFFTSHVYGFEKMLESKWAIDAEEGRGWSVNQEANLFNQVTNKANTDNYEQKLRLYLTDSKTNGELYVFQLKNGHLTKHTNQILKKLQNEGVLIVTNRDGGEARRSAFYICYQNYKKEPDKVIIKIK